MQAIREICDKEKIGFAEYALRAEAGLEPYLDKILTATPLLP